MRRRDFIGSVGILPAALPQPAKAQSIQTTRSVGVLMSVTDNDAEGQAQFSGFRLRLSELGWTEDRNLRMHVRWGGGNVDQIRLFAKELVALQPDLIVAQGTPVTAALQRETRTIPIVFVVVTDPVGEGFIAALSRPGGSTTGFLTSEAGIGAKMLGLLTEIAPGLSRVAMLFNPDTAPGSGLYYLRDFEAAARSSKIEPTAARARTDAEIETALRSLGKLRSGLIVMPDFFMFNHVRPIIVQAAINRVPTIYPWRYVVVTGMQLTLFWPARSKARP